MNLPANQLSALQAVARANPNLVVVLVNGSTVVLGDVTPYAVALVEAWLGGQAAGPRSSTSSPAGSTHQGAWPRPSRTGSRPSSYLNFPGDSQVVHYGEVSTSGIAATTRPAGRRLPLRLRLVVHDLRAVGPDRDDLGLRRRRQPVGHGERAVSSTGPVAGAEVVQVYVRDVEASARRPVR